MRMHFYEKMGYSLVGKIEPFGFEFNRWFNTIIIDKNVDETLVKELIDQSYELTR